MKSDKKAGRAEQVHDRDSVAMIAAFCQRDKQEV